MSSSYQGLFLLLGIIPYALGLNATENTTQLTLSNSRLSATVSKAGGAITSLTLDGQNLLGTRSGSTGIGPYLDCYCTPSGFYTPGSIAPSYKLITGTDSTNTAYGGIIMSEVYPPTGQLLEQYWFLREGETGLHVFSRLAYYNETKPFLRNLQEFRTLFRPNTPLWTHLLTNKNHYAPLPSKNAVSKQVVVQDATWYLGNTPEDPYVKQEGEYFTKYIFADTWRDHDAHGLFADGSQSPGNETFGAWLVHNTRETYFGGPLHSDLTVDGIVYNYLVSNHHGDGTPNITNGFDRTFGPQYYYFNKGAPGSSLETLRSDAAKLANPTWNTEFYDSIAKHVPNYVPSSNRTTWNGEIDLPTGAKDAVAVLAQDGVDFQDNDRNPSKFQYWSAISPSGSVTIPSVVAGTYRLTVYASGIFGQYTKDGIVIKPGVRTATHAKWTPESHGTEIFRIGTPDLSAGEFRHGNYPSPNATLHPPEYKNYWPVHDFVNDFPSGVKYVVGESDPARDFNYVHWSVFGGYGNSIRTVPYVGHGEVNNWTVVFDVEKQRRSKSWEQATFTVQLAGVKTAAGNTDVYNASEPWANLPYTVVVNNHELEPWVIPYYRSSSCAVRSEVSCYNVANKFVFPATFLKEGKNEIVLSLPYNATDYESAILARSIYVQYDALRLEVK
ncbi:polysaccharide lyase family 4 protein [Bisporella sp. PMI_857]|nr:polysaccharide lyase family 4 protein [Bisporella sp. PMI_857]